MGQLRAIQQKQDELLAVVDSMSQSGAQLGGHSPTVASLRPSPVPARLSELENEDAAAASAAALASKSTATPPLRPATDGGSPIGSSSPTQSAFTSRIILTWVSLMYTTS